MRMTAWMKVAVHPTPERSDTGELTFLALAVDLHAKTVRRVGVILDAAGECRYVNPSPDDALAKIKTSLTRSLYTNRIA